ncbi:MAG: phosphotransferase [Pseudomonadota bacterium]
MAQRVGVQELERWAAGLLYPEQTSLKGDLVPLAGDASSRRYFRLILEAKSYVLTHAPPPSRENEVFVRRQALLSGAGVRVPVVYGSDSERGLLLQEDLGDCLLLSKLETDTADHLYAAALDLLFRLQSLEAEKLLPPYSADVLNEELQRFPSWFVEGLLGQSLDDEIRDLFDELTERLVNSALEQPRVAVHRDFHSRNLMCLPDGELAVIDFQDAVWGPVTYDLVSLTKDCYRRWPAASVKRWALEYRTRLLNTGFEGLPDESGFLRWMDWMGLQRHLKVLGTFARLALRDEKTAYLDDLPLVVAYCQETLASYPEEPAFTSCLDWFDDQLLPAMRAHEWGRML